MISKSILGASLALVLLGISGAARAESSGVFAEQHRDRSITGSESVRVTLGPIASMDGAFGVNLAVDVAIWKSLYVGPVAFAALGDELWLLGGIRAGVRLPIHANIDLFPWVSAAAFYGSTFGSNEYGMRRTITPVSPVAGLRAAYRPGLIVLGLEALVTVNEMEYSDGVYTSEPMKVTDVEVLPFVGAFIGLSL